MLGNSTKSRQKQDLQRDKVLTKAGELFWRNGFHTTNVKQIAESCGFESGNLYYYFKNKEHILYEVIKGEVEKVVLSVEHLKDDQRMSPVDRLKSFIKIHMKIASGRPQRAYSLLFETGLKDLTTAHRRKVIELRDTYDSILRKIIQDGVKNGEFTTPDVYVAAVAIASIILRTRVWFTPKGRISTDELGEIIAELALNMLCYGRVS